MTRAGDPIHREPLISFVGAGPGAPDLMTLRGADRLSCADVVVWASSLVPELVLAHARGGAVVHDSAAMTLEDVLAVYASHPDARIVRLHSGDPSLYGAIHEQIEWCIANDRSFEIVPGVSSVSAAAAVLKKELTVPGVSQSVVLTRLASRTAESVPDGDSISGFAAAPCTLAIFLSAARPEALQQELLAPPSRLRPDTPAAIVIRASWPDEKVVESTVGNLAEDIRLTGETKTVLVLVGDALAGDGSGDGSGGGALRSHLYSPEFAHAFRRRSAPGTTTGRPAATGRVRARRRATGG
jgi:precorrin-4/cobalt-precorrin-4 C11-methyltransferase